ncbi:hypothetical protein [Psychroserpens mesophilus]|uniref:hypothetical protein n=1 Tax=Psychroserpens mesophilus TaxID=325473 RepID=UPI00058B75DF|nr:hypothetical protein [Psychroserpens mesophilus]
MTETEQNLIDSGRCNLFQNIATEVWKRIIRAHDVGVNLREEGITYDILVDILQFSKYYSGNFDVFAKSGYDENVYGSDMDVFVETSKNQYRWFALQAKILKSNNRYDTLRDGYSANNRSYQWDKLKLLEGVSGCKAFYLLYNGKERAQDFDFTETDNCNRPYTEDQLGCSLVSVSIIEKLGLRRNPGNTQFKNPTYEDIHPHNSEPWRTLVCCMLDKAKETLYAREEVESYNSKFIPIEVVSKEILGEGLQIDIDFKSDSENSNNSISIASKEAGWNPTFKLVINRSDKL